MAAPPDKNANLKGTSRPSFKIGKGGPLLSQVVGDPDRLLLPPKVRWTPTAGALGVQASGDLNILSDTDLATRSGGQMSFQTSGTVPYVQTSNTTTFQQLGLWIFPGTASYTPTLGKIIVAASNNSGNNMEVQIFDETNAQVIALFTFPAQTTPQILNQALASLPLGEAIFSVSARRNGGGFARTRLYNLTIR